MSKPQLVSLDVETTGLDVRFHEIWEVALVFDGFETPDPIVFQFPINSHHASPEALQIGHFYERRDLDDVPPQAKCREIAEHTAGAHFLGCAISFDMKFLEALLRAHDVAPAWHHRALDLGSYAAARIGKDFPLSSREMQERVPNDSPHTALGDALWNWSAYHWFRNYRRPEYNEPDLIGPRVD